MNCTQSLSTAEELRRLIEATRSEQNRWLRWIRIAASTGIGAAAVQFNPAVGLLAALGFSVGTEFGGKRIDSVLEPVVRRLRPHSRQHLSLLLDLDDSVRRHFKDAGQYLASPAASGSLSLLDSQDVKRPLIGYPRAIRYRKANRY